MAKTIGIITTFRQPNWGSVLQAYALQRVIESLGYKTEVIDYIYPNDFHFKRGVRWGNEDKTFKSLVKSRIRPILCFFHLRSYSKMHLLNKFIREQMTVSKPFPNREALIANPPKYDVYVAGSDQIWNPNTMMGDMSYMFDFVKDDGKKISYASSFSCLYIPDNYRDDYIRYLSSFSYISVREANGNKILKELLHKDLPVVLDPTLLINKEEWEKIAARAVRPKGLPEKYILCYMLAYTFKVDEPMNKLLQQVQKKYDVPVVFFTAPPDNFNGKVHLLEKNYNLGISEFLYLISNAYVVVSSSFHGVAFALNLGRPLIALAKQNGDDRVKTLIDAMDLNDNYVQADDVSKDAVNSFYQIEREQALLDELREKSIGYLRSALD